MKATTPTLPPLVAAIATAADGRDFADITRSLTPIWTAATAIAAGQHHDNDTAPAVNWLMEHLTRAQTDDQKAMRAALPREHRDALFVTEFDAAEAGILLGLCLFAAFTRDGAR